MRWIGEWSSAWLIACDAVSREEPMRIIYTLVASIALAALPVQAANNWEVGRTQYNSICTSCHNANINQANGGFPAVAPTGANAGSLQTLINGGMGAPNTNPLRTGANSTINDTVSDIAAYIGNPTFPTAAPDPASRNFGAVTINTSAQHTFTITNNGNEALDATVSITGTGYTRSPENCNAAPNGGTCSITVTFSPTAVDSYSGTLSINDADLLNGKTDIDLTGSGGDVPPRLRILRNGIELVTAADLRLQFGTQAINGLYAPIALTLRNAGTADGLEVSLPALASAPGFEFAPVGSCANLPAFGQCTLNVSFRPTAPQPYSAMLILGSRPAGSGAAFSATALELAGSGAASQPPALRWTLDAGPDPAAITAQALPDTAAGATSAPRTVRLFNAGPGNVVLSVVNVLGADGAAFKLDETGCRPTLVVSQGESCALAVRFAPSTSGSKAAVLQATAAGGSDAPLIVAPQLSLSAQANPAAPPPTLSLSTSQIDFGGHVAGSESDVRVLRLQNAATSAGPAVVQSIVVSGPFAVHGGTCGSVPLVIQPNAECSLNLVFTPQAEGNVAGTLTVGYDSAPAALEVALAGTGEPKADLSNGGCSIARGDSPADPTLWLLLLLAVGALLRRRKQVETP
jgi:trimeric autotransporter adhesin